MRFRRWQGPERPVSEDGAVSHFTLVSDIDAPRAARAAIASTCTGTSEEVLERAALLATEIVTNSVKFSPGSKVDVEVWRSLGTVAVVVSDDGPGFDPEATPYPRMSGSGGMGLPLVDALSEAWGSGSDDCSWVWFEVSPRLFSRPTAQLSSAL